MKAKISKSFYRLMNQVRSGLVSACMPSKLVMIMMICMSANACSGEIDKTKNITVDGQTINYDKIYTDVSQLLNVKPNTKEVFVRWELPIRYYVAGLQCG